MDNNNIPLANVTPLNPMPDMSKPLPKPPPSPLDSAVTPYKENTSSKPIVPDFFQGFAPVYPEYEVLTPQTLITLTLRSMTVQEEESLKGSMVNRRQTPTLINKAIYNALVNNPYGSYENFLKKVTIRDRDALLYGLYHVTYKDIQNYEIQCPECETPYTVKVDLNKIFKMHAYHGEPNQILTEKFTVPLETVQNAIAVIKQPTLEDENNMLSDMLFQSDKNIEMGIEMLIIDRFIGDPDGRTPVHVESRADIFKAYSTMLPKDRKTINRTYMQQFGKYAIDLTMQCTCTNCSHHHNVRLDLLTQFFRSLFE